MAAESATRANDAAASRERVGGFNECIDTAKVAPLKLCYGVGAIRSPASPLVGSERPGTARQALCIYRLKQVTDGWKINAPRESFPHALVP